jgi:anti-anti-sigma regulatory factor
MGEDTKISIDLGSALVLQDIAQWQVRLSEGLDSTDCLVLSGAEIEQIDGAGLQLLAALRLEADEKGKSVVWKGVSGELYKAAQIVGLDQVLGLGEQNNA